MSNECVNELIEMLNTGMIKGVKNPQRALAECLLKVLEQLEKEKEDDK